MTAEFITMEPAIPDAMQPDLHADRRAVTFFDDRGAQVVWVDGDLVDRARAAGAVPLRDLWPVMQVIAREMGVERSRAGRYAWKRQTGLRREGIAEMALRRMIESAREDDHASV